MNDRWRKPIQPLITPIKAIGTLIVVAAF